MIYLTVILYCCPLNSATVRRIFYANTIQYQYDCLNFDSSWELVYYIWLKHNNIEFEFHPNIRLQYMIDEKQHYYKPDFIVNNELVEIKGDHLVKRMSHEKYECMLTNNVKILFRNDIKPILKWYKENFTIPLSDYKYRRKE